jgi:hypothetical protein
MKMCNWKRVGEGIAEDDDDDDDGSITYTYLYRCSDCGEWKRE